MRQRKKGKGMATQADIEQNANQFVANAKGQWTELVKLARNTTPRNRAQAARSLAEAAGVGKSTLLRKLEALHAAMAAGLEDEELIAKGQRWTLAKFIADKRNGRDDEQVVLKWLVSPENRDAAHENFWRIGKILSFTTSDQLWAFLNSQMEQWSDEEIKHAAGEMR